MDLKQAKAMHAEKKLVEMQETLVVMQIEINESRAAML